MTIDGDGEWFPLPNEDAHRVPAAAPLVRLDSLLPRDAETGVATYEALRTYLGASMDLMARHGQPLTLLVIAPDASETLLSLGDGGARLIRAAIARYLRQETRIHDVVGRGPGDGAHGVPSFLLVLPLIAEPLGAQFAERLR